MTNEEDKIDKELKERVADVQRAMGRTDRDLFSVGVGGEEEKESEKVKFFKYLTCKNTLHVGLRRLLLVLSFPFFVCWIIPGILFWVIVHAIVWIYEGFVSDDKKPPIQGNNIFSREKN